MKLFLSGHINQIEQLRLACIRLTLSGHIVICPMLMCRGYFNDDRLRQAKNWYEKVVKHLIQSCECFVYLTEPCGCWQTRMERSLVPKAVPMVPFDVIQEWLWKNVCNKK
jgi:hypothetical protein